MDPEDLEAAAAVAASRLVAQAIQVRFAARNERLTAVVANLVAGSQEQRRSLQRGSKQNAIKYERRQSNVHLTSPFGTTAAADHLQVIPSHSTPAEAKQMSAADASIEVS